MTRTLAGLFRLAPLLCCAALLADPGELPPELSGKWTMRTGSGSSYRDPATGQHSAPTGNIFTYTIFPDGRYEHAALLSSSLYQCTMQIFGHETGHIVVGGDGSITFADESGTFKSRDTCRPQWNYEKPGKISRLRVGWRIERDRIGLKLVITRPGGTQESYYRE